MAAEKQAAEGLNEHHRRRLLVSCQYIDRLLSEIESLLHSASSRAVFPRYRVDITTDQRQVIEDYIARIRAHLLRLLERQGIPYQTPGIPATRAIHSSLSVIQISVEELNPRHLRGYGAVPEAAAAQLKPVVAELQELVASMNRYVVRCQRQAARSSRREELEEME